MVAKQKLTPNFQQAVLKTVSQPIPQPQPSVGGQTTTEPPQSGSVSGTLPKDFPFSTLFELIDPINQSLKTMAKYENADGSVILSEIASALSNYIKNNVKELYLF